MFAPETAGDTVLPMAPCWLGEPELLDAFGRYERALMADDVGVLDAAFADGQAVLRADAGHVLVGHDAITDFRRSRGGAPQREVVRLHLRPLDADLALLVAETSRADGGTGVTTQVWERLAAGWHVTAAHVSQAPPAPGSSGPGPGPVWRLPPGATPLVAGAGDGPLCGVRVAVKDLFAVAGERVGAGNPSWLAEAEVETAHAAAVTALVGAGADVVGIAHTDELAFSLAGASTHYGATPNPAAPGRASGGSSSGSAAAVAAGQADLGLGTDTAGSIRVPASYCGLLGLRTTHGAVDTGGLVGLARSFDTVGLLARDADVLVRAARALLAPAPTPWLSELAVAPALLRLVDGDMALAFEAGARALAVRTGLPVRDVDLDPDEIEPWLPAFRLVQAVEAWAEHGDFVTTHPGGLDPVVEARFAAGAAVTPTELGAAHRVLDGARARLREIVGAGAALLVPSTASPAYPSGAPPEEIESVRVATQRLTCLASLAGLPALSVPALRVGTLPAGLSLIGPAGADLALVDLLTRRTA